MLQISKFVENPLEVTGGDTWYHPITKQTVGLGPHIRQLLPEILKQELTQDAESHHEILVKLIAFELRDRGFILEDKNVTDERVFLESLVPLELPSRGILNIPTAYYDTIPENTELVFLGVPSDGGAGRPGSRYAMDFLRSSSNDLNFRSNSANDIFSISNQSFLIENMKIFDVGDIVIDNKTIHNCRDIVQKVLTDIPKTTVPFLIGGDHSLTLGALRGIQKKYNGKFSYIHLDSHLDIYLSGGEGKTDPYFFDGLPDHANFVSYIKREMPDVTIHQVGVCDYISLQSSFREKAIDYINNIGNQISDLNILVNGAKAVLSKLPRNENIYISLDVDVLKSAIMAKTGYPTPTGLELKDLVTILLYLLEHNNIIGFDLMEFGSSHEFSDHSESSMMLVRLILLILARIRRVSL